MCLARTDKCTNEHKLLSFWFCFFLPLFFLYGTWARTCHSFLSIGNSHGKHFGIFSLEQTDHLPFYSFYLTRSSGQFHRGLLSIFTWFLYCWCCGPFAQRFMQIGELPDSVYSFYSAGFLHFFVLQSSVPLPILVRCFLRPPSTSETVPQLRPHKHIWFIINLSERAHMRRPISSGVSAPEEDCMKGRGWSKMMKKKKRKGSTRKWHDCRAKVCLCTDSLWVKFVCFIEFITGNRVESIISAAQQLPKQSTWRPISANQIVERIVLLLCVSSGASIGWQGECILFAVHTFNTFWLCPIENGLHCCHFHSALCYCNHWQFICLTTTDDYFKFCTSLSCTSGWTHWRHCTALCSTCTISLHIDATLFLCSQNLCSIHFLGISSSATRGPCLISFSCSFLLLLFAPSSGHLIIALI